MLGSGISILLSREIAYSYKDLIILSLVCSDNSAANELIDFIGWEGVEKYAKSIGMGNTTFRYKMMIAAGRGSNLTTANDMAELLEGLYMGKFFGSDDILDIMSEQIDRTRIPLLLPNEIKVSCKNGSLPEAMHEVGIVYSKCSFIFCFLSDNQKDKRLTNEVLSMCAKVCYDYSVS